MPARILGACLRWWHGTTDPPSVNLCNPDFTLILRDKNSKIIYGLTATADSRGSRNASPANTDYSKAQVYVAQGVTSLGINPAQPASCRGQ